MKRKWAVILAVSVVLYGSIAAVFIWRYVQGQSLESRNNEYLIGVSWVNYTDPDNERMKFGSDGQHVVITGQGRWERTRIAKYTIDGNTIVISWDQGPETLFIVRLDGEVLILRPAQGRERTFRRVQSGN